MSSNLIARSNFFKGLTAVYEPPFSVGKHRVSTGGQFRPVSGCQSVRRKTGAEGAGHPPHGLRRLSAEVLFGHSRNTWGVAACGCLTEGAVRPQPAPTPWGEEFIASCRRLHLPRPSLCHSRSARQIGFLWQELRRRDDMRTCTRIRRRLKLYHPEIQSLDRACSR